MDTFISEVVAGILSNVLSALLISTVAPIIWHLFVRLVNFWLGEPEDEPLDDTVSSDVPRGAMASIEGERPCSDLGIMDGITGSVREQEKHFVNCDMPLTSGAASIDPTQESSTVNSPC